MTTKSFKHAFDGIVEAISKHPNLRIHLLASVLVLLFAFYLKISHLELVLLILTIGFVITAEMLNTAVESMTDLITNDYRLEAKTAKDVAAGMVLIASFFAICIGILIFIPHINFW